MGRGRKREEHSRRSQRCSRGAGIMFLANILSINSANIRTRHIGSQMDVGTGAGRRGAEVPCTSVCGGADRRQVVRPRVMSVQWKEAGVLREPREGAPMPGEQCVLSQPSMENRRGWGRMQEGQRRAESGP